MANVYTSARALRKQLSNNSEAPAMRRLLHTLRPVTAKSDSPEAGSHIDRRRDYAFTILPDFRQLVQTRILLLPFAVFAFTGRRLTFQRRLVMLCACETLLPNCGPLPQTSQTCAMTGS